MTGVSRLVLAATVVVWSWPLAGAAEEHGQDAAPSRAARPVLEPSQLLRIAAINETLVNGEPMLKVTLERLDGGRGAAYYVPNPAGATGANAVNPPPPVVGQLKEAGIGAIVRARITGGEYGMTLVGIEPVPYLPGEDTPNSYVFVRTSTIGHEGGKYVLVQVTKFGRPSTFIVPDGSDPALTSALASSKAGTVLEVQTTDERIAEHPVIRYLGEYRPTLTGRILGLNDDASGRPQVRIKVGEETVELAVPAADAAAPRLNRKILAALVAGRTVRFTATGGKTPSLRSIELACSFRVGRQGSEEHLVTCGDTSFAAEQSSPNQYRISPQREHGIGSSGAALLAQSDLRYQLLLDTEQLRRVEGVLYPVRGRVRGPGIQIDEAAVGEAVGVVLAAADPDQRFEAEQKLYGLVQDYIARIDAMWDQRDREVRKILTPEQYEVLQSSRTRGGMFIIEGQSRVRVGARGAR